ARGHGGAAPRRRRAPGGRAGPRGREAPARAGRAAAPAPRARLGRPGVHRGGAGDVGPRDARRRPRRRVPAVAPARGVRAVRAEAAAAGAARLPRDPEALGRGAHVRLAGPAPAAREGLRAPAGDGGGARLRGDDAPHAPAPCARV
ncbi:MAG: Mobile element protein, partial [uncultured Gemmatimonadaceae bacterium]